MNDYVKSDFVVIIEIQDTNYAIGLIYGGFEQWILVIHTNYTRLIR
jgi:hypothetical protein